MRSITDGVRSRPVEYLPEGTILALCDHSFFTASIVPPYPEIPMSVTRRVLISAIASIVLLSACGSTSGYRAPARDVNRIGYEEISLRTFSSAYNVVETLRPQWLRSRATRTFTGPVEILVYVDGVRMGTPRSLYNLSADAVEEMEWLDAATATQRWGTGHAGGVISVLTRRY